MMAILIFVALAVNCVQVITGNKKNQNQTRLDIKGIVYYKNYSYLCYVINEIQCNGSTTDFGSVSPSSTLGISTNHFKQVKD